MSADHLKAPSDFSPLHTPSRVQERAALTDASMKELRAAVKHFYRRIMANAPWSQQCAESRVLFLAEVSPRPHPLSATSPYGVEGTGPTPVAGAVRERLAGGGHDAPAALQPLEGPPP